MTIHSIISLALVMGLGLAGVVYSAQTVEPLGVLGSAAFANLVVAAVAVSERRSLTAAGASRSKVESVTARYLGLLWLWGAAALILVHTLALSWREWPHFSAAFAGVGLVSLGFSWLLGKDAAVGREDPTLLKLGRYLAVGLLVGMIATIVGLFVDPGKVFLTPTKSDWAASGTIVFGALALALVAAHALFDGNKNSS
jgi:hypothetical protein